MKILNYLKLFYQCTIFIVLTFLILLPPSLIAFPFNEGIRNKITHPFWKFFSRLFLRLAAFSRLNHIEKENLDPKSGPYILIANHQCMSDVPLLVCYYRMAALMKLAVRKIPAFGFSAEMAGSIAVNRKSMQSKTDAFKKCKEKLANGFNLFYFPEGTRSRENKPKSFENIKIPLLKEAYKLGIKVKPVTIYGTKNLLKSGSGLDFGRNLYVLGNNILDPKDFKDENEFAKQAWNQVCMGMDELIELDAKNSFNFRKLLPLKNS